MITRTPSRSPAPADEGPPRTSYDLLTQPWLLLRDPGADSGVREVGLLEAFERAHEVTGLAGEIPTQEAACLRLMLAVLYRALDGPGDAVAAWDQLWQAGRLPIERIRDYLTPYADRFDLLHPQNPFFQVCDLRTDSGKTSGLGKLVAEMPDGYPFFTTRSAQDISRLSYGEAARWLVHAHAYDCSGIKSGAVGDRRVKGGKGYPIGTGFAGTLGLLLAEGATLAETLLLNVVLGMDTTTDRVPWEHDHLGAAVSTDHTQPGGPAAAATWQSRRVRLMHDGYAVTDAVLANGDPIGPQNRRSVEPNSSWRFSEPQTKKLGGTTYMPLEHSPSRSLWRGLSATLGQRTTQAATKARVRAFEMAEVLEWLSSLREDGVLPPERAVPLRAVGMTYGSQSASVTEVIDDRIVLPLAVLSDPQVRECATAAVERADAAVREVGRLATRLADAAGRHLLPGMDDGARDEAVRTAFAQLDPHYRRWVRTLSDPSVIDAHDVAWQQTLRQELTELASELVVAAGLPAQVGREAGGRYLNAPIAENWFRVALRKTLPRAYPDHSAIPERQPDQHQEDQ